MQAGKSVIYVATAQVDPADSDWLFRIEQHRCRRPRVGNARSAGLTGGNYQNRSPSCLWLIRWVLGWLICSSRMTPVGRGTVQNLLVWSRLLGGNFGLQRETGRGASLSNRSDVPRSPG